MFPAMLASEVLLFHRAECPGGERNKRMNDQEARHIIALEARIKRLETMMEQLLTILSNSGSEMQKFQRIQGMLQELHSGQGVHTTSAAGTSLPAVAPPERPLNGAIQAALQKGDNLKAIKLYREIYNVSLQEAAEALNIQLHGR
jgi:hypothetical protein